MPGSWPGCSEWAAPDACASDRRRRSPLRNGFRVPGGQRQRQPTPTHARNSPEERNSSPESCFFAATFGPDGVPEDMATLVLDNSALGAGAPAGLGRTGRPATTASLDPASDAAIMLRVAAGDESGFNYLAEKYHRPMIHFLFRMVRNQAIAEELAQEVFLRVYRSQGELPGGGQVHHLALPDRHQPGGEPRARHQA